MLSTDVNTFPVLVLGMAGDEEILFSMDGVYYVGLSARDHNSLVGS